MLEDDRRSQQKMENDGILKKNMTWNSEMLYNSFKCEEYDDINNNMIYDNGEAFEDDNNNGKWDYGNLDNI